MNDLDELKMQDGYNEWRAKEHKSLSDLIQRRLSFVQNPKDCSKARKLVCDVRFCGFGCQMHHLVSSPCIYFSLVPTSTDCRLIA